MPPAQAIILEGSVVDGPVVDADIRILDADGTELATTTADSNARYLVQIPEGAKLPLQVLASGGTDLVTGRPLDFELAGLVGSDGPQLLNLSPLGTMAMRSASCAGNLTDAGVDQAWSVVRDKLAMGLDTDQISDIATDRFDANNIATVVLANEALGEALRRASGALAGTGDGTTADDVLARVACDLVDGELDGSGGTSADPRTTATFRAAEVGVVLETIAGRLEVDGQDATALMDQSIATVMADAAGQSVNNVPVTEELVNQAKEAAIALETNDPTFGEVIEVLASESPATVSARMDAFLTADKQNSVDSVRDSVALADQTEIDEIQNRFGQQRAAQTPFLSISAEQTQVSSGGSTILSWATAGADRCFARGDWEGAQSTEGVLATNELSQSARYSMTCVGVGGSVTQFVDVDVIGQPTAAELNEVIPEPARDPQPEPQPAPPAETPAPAPAPEEPVANEPAPAPAPEAPVSDAPVSDAPTAEAPAAQISASARSIAAGENVTLRWSSVNADSCEADGSWAGALSSRGSELVGPISQDSTFRLVCSGAGGSAVAIVTVQVEADGSFTLAWTPPQLREDGTVATELSGFRIYYGEQSGSYPNVAEVNDGRINAHTVAAPQGTYYVVMTALDEFGYESGYSNELVATVQ